jgi:rhamnose transport system ATP-binding protein
MTAAAGGPPAAHSRAPPVLQVHNLSKRFDMTQALKDVSLALHAGEIHALVGENGAGKSTLIKILTGVVQSDAGEVIMEGAAVRLANAQEAQACGLAAVYQEPLLFPDLDVAENIFITHREQGLLTNWRRMYAEAEDILLSLGTRLDVRAPARGLTLAAQQEVEIAKAISLDVKVLIMDEPTASLSEHEVAQLFRVARQLRDRGVAVLFITHRLEEVFQIADRITVLRDGEHVSTRLASEVTRDLLIRDMVGRAVDQFYGVGQARTVGERVCRVRALGREGVFSGIDFDLHAGEVLGFAGLVGSRRTDVGLTLFGMQPADRGAIEIDGQEQRITSPRVAQQLGVAYMTEDRRKFGLAMPLSITANITLPVLRRYLSRIGLIRRASEEAAAEGFRQRLQIKAPSTAHVVAKLSGGNQQKVMFGKWLNTRPRILVLDEPTRGIDVGAKAEVHTMVRELAEQGMAILFISSDLPEVLAMSDRILVMREGRQMGILGQDEATQEAVMSLATGDEGRMATAPAGSPDTPAGGMAP